MFWISERKSAGWEPLIKRKHTRGIKFLDELSTKIKQTLFFLWLLMRFSGCLLIFAFLYSSFFSLTAVNTKKISSIFVTRKSYMDKEWEREGEFLFCRFCRNNIYVHVQLDGGKKRARVKFWRFTYFWICFICEGEFWVDAECNIYVNFNISPVTAAWVHMKDFQLRAGQGKILSRRKMFCKHIWCST